MDSYGHTRMANALLSYLNRRERVSFERKAFLFGNLKPDLSGEYLSKRHYPSLMLDEVLERLSKFIRDGGIDRRNDNRVSEELGVICHYLTDFFSYPHNDDIYHHNLFMHYVYEKRTFPHVRRVNEKRFAKWADRMAAKQFPENEEQLIKWIRRRHDEYVDQRGHSIDDDIRWISGILAVVGLFLCRMSKKK